MKKIYFSALALMVAGAVNAQGWWTGTSYRGAFPQTDGLTGIASNDWTAGWTNFSPEDAAYGAPTVTVSSDITANTTWTTGSIVLLQNKIYVKNGATLTIQPGVIVRGEKASQGTLIITRGSKINAQGTAQAPIVFTSAEADVDRAPGDWGGVLILGNGILNQPGGVANVEGLTATSDTQYGGNDNSDSSGVFSYCRIEFSGIALQPNKETNGLTLAAVGNRTKLDHIQISFSGDDGIEWFGGHTNTKYVISFRSLDDDFDTDFGAKGNVQFGLAVRDADLSDAAGDSNGFESDNEGTSPYLAQPKTSLVFSNITMVGPLRNGTVTLPGTEKFERAVYTRRNTNIGIYNSIFTSWEKGWHVKDAVTNDNFAADSTRFANNIISSDIATTFVIDGASNSTTTFYNTYAALMSIDTASTNAQINFVNGFAANLSSVPDYRLDPTSVAISGASFNHPAFANNVIGVKENKNETVSSVKVYPNPAANNVSVKLNMVQTETVSVNIYDITGKNVATVYANELLNEGTHTLSVNTSTFDNGMYFVSITTNSTKQTVKLIINK
ncbi:MAG: T9SS type A sorting domain-containing protein [Bacteroidota bacterium]|nr:T9SS type A sorting domain-containing protein [Bacteroidota bacterium]